MEENLERARRDPNADAVGQPESGGFSPAERLVLPTVRGGEWGHEEVNVAAEWRHPASFLNWMERTARLRLRYPEFGAPRCGWLEAGDPAVLANCSREDKSACSLVQNLSGREVDTTINLGRKVDEDGQHWVRLAPYSRMTPDNRGERHSRTTANQVLLTIPHNGRGFTPGNANVGEAHLQAAFGRGVADSV